MTIGDRLRKARIHAGITQVQLAKAMAASQRLVSHLENSENVEWASIERYATALRMTPDKALGFTATEIEESIGYKKRTSLDLRTFLTWGPEKVTIDFEGSSDSDNEDSINAFFSMVSKITEDERYTAGEEPGIFRIPTNVEILRFLRSASSESLRQELLERFERCLERDWDQGDYLEYVTLSTLATALAVEELESLTETPGLKSALSQVVFNAGFYRFHKTRMLGVPLAVLACRIEQGDVSDEVLRVRKFLLRSLSITSFGGPKKRESFNPEIPEVVGMLTDSSRRFREFASKGGKIDVEKIYTDAEVEEDLVVALLNGDRLAELMFDDYQKTRLAAAVGASLVEIFSDEARPYYALSEDLRSESREALNGLESEIGTNEDAISAILLLIETGILRHEQGPNVLMNLIRAGESALGLSPTENKEPPEASGQTQANTSDRPDSPEPKDPVHQDTEERPTAPDPPMRKLRRVEFSSKEDLKRMPREADPYARKLRNIPSPPDKEGSQEADEC